MKALCMLIFVLAVAFAAGCADLCVGNPFKCDTELIAKGHTSKDEIRKWVGQPLFTIQNPNGETWVYRYVDKDGNNFKELIISFTGEKVCSFTEAH
jgi:SmpA / OmlA family